MPMVSEPPNHPPGSSFQSSAMFLPAKFLPVKFSLANTAEPTTNRLIARPDYCCPGTSCSRLKLRRVYCCGEIFKAFSAGCTEAGGFCSALGDTVDVPCNDTVGTYCLEDLLATCATGEPTTRTAPTTPSSST